MSKIHPQYDNNLHLLAEDITRAIKENQDGTTQKDQVDRLMELEEEFRRNITRFGQAREVYKKFILLIAITNKNILSARPYFRENSDVFNAEITPAIKSTNIRKLQKFHPNYNLIIFIKKNWLGPFPENAEKVFKEIESVRSKLIENNMPLAINRAKRFYRKVPRSHLSLMDLIGIASMGLISGIDKYSAPAYTKVFNGVCIGRMTGNMIDEYSDTTLHFYPSDRTILYRANSLRFKLGIEDLNALAEAMNKSYEEDKKNGIRTPKDKITPGVLADLLYAASPVSSNETVGTGDTEPLSLLDVAKIDLEEPPNSEDLLIKKDLQNKLVLFAKKLPVIQRKVLRLKGVKI